MNDNSWDFKVRSGDLHSGDKNENSDREQQSISLFMLTFLSSEQCELGSYWYTRSLQWCQLGKKLFEKHIPMRPFVLLPYFPDYPHMFHIKMIIFFTDKPVNSELDNFPQNN